MSDSTTSDHASPKPKYDPAKPEYNVLLTITPFNHEVQTVEDKFLTFDEKDVDEERAALTKRYENGRARMMNHLKKSSAVKDASRAIENRERMYKQQLGEINNKLSVRNNQESQRQDYLKYIAETVLNIDHNIRKVFIRVVKDGEKWCASAWKGDKDTNGTMLATTKISENSFCASLLDALYQLWLILQDQLVVPMRDTLRLTVPQINALRALLKGVL